MKYVCPECKHAGESAWYQNKDKVACEVCQYSVFTSIKTKITLLRIVSLVFFAIGSYALKIQSENIWLSITFLFVLLACWKAAEYAMCQRVNRKAMGREDNIG